MQGSYLSIGGLISIPISWPSFVAINIDMAHLQRRVVVGVAGGVQGHVRYLARLAHYEDLQWLRHLAASQDSSVDNLPPLVTIFRKMKLIHPKM